MQAAPFCSLLHFCWPRNNSQPNKDRTANRGGFAANFELCLQVFCGLSSVSGFGCQTRCCFIVVACKAATDFCPQTTLKAQIAAQGSAKFGRNTKRLCKQTSDTKNQCKTRMKNAPQKSLSKQSSAKQIKTKTKANVSYKKRHKQSRTVQKRASE